MAVAARLVAEPRVEAGDRPAPSAGAVPGTVTRLSRAAGNRALGRALAVQRTRIEVDGEEVPGTKDEHLPTFNDALVGASSARLEQLERALLALGKGTPFDQLALEAVRARRKPPVHAGDEPRTGGGSGGTVKVSVFASAPTLSSGSGSDADTGSSGPSTKRPRTDVEPANPLALLPLELVQHILVQQRHADLPQLFLVDHFFRANIVQLVRERFLPLEPNLTYGVIKILGRYEPNRRLAQEPRHDEDRRARVEALASVDDLPLVGEIVRAIGWRRYSCALRVAPGAITLTLRAFADDVVRHTHATRAVRANQSYLASPWKNVLVGSDEVNGLLAEIRTHWAELHSSSPAKGAVVLEDRLAVKLEEVLGLDMFRGDNISVVRGPRRTWSVYVNKPLGDTAILRLERMGFVVELARRTDRERWTYELGGQQRADPYDLPFHSEQQRTLTQEPWQLGYAGNMLDACIQCLASYFAMGIQSGRGFRGSHGRKAKSIIPPKIRRNTVYLELYLGKAGTTLVTGIAALAEELHRQALRLAALDRQRQSSDADGGSELATLETDVQITAMLRAELVNRLMALLNHLEHLAT